MYGSGVGGIYGSNMGSMYGGGMGSMYGGGYGGSMYGGGLGSMYGGGMGGNRMGMGGIIGGPGGMIDPNNPPGPPPNTWARMMMALQNVVGFAGKIAWLVDENSQALHFFMTALLGLLDRGGVLYGELARFVLRLLGYKPPEPPKLPPGTPGQGMMGGGMMNRFGLGGGGYGRGYGGGYGGYGGAGYGTSSPYGGGGFDAAWGG